MGAGEVAPTTPFMYCLSVWCFTCMHACVLCLYLVLMGAKRACLISRDWSLPSPGPLDEQPVLLMADPLIIFFRTESHSVAQDGYDSLDWPRTHGNPLASVLWVLALQVWVTMPTSASFTAIQKAWSPPKIPGVLSEPRWQLPLCRAQGQLALGYAS